ncbi:MAG: hypothetical protein MJ108_03280 [Saccharofermentans sp.]|nr:hypothetical protein [Saccharofermentans sp.]
MAVLERQNRRLNITEIEVEDYSIDDEIFGASDAAISEETEQEREERLVAEEKASKRKVRRLTRRRLFETVLAISLIVLCGVFVWLLIYPQMELSEISRDNSDLKDEITVLKKQVMDSEEDANGITDMDSIRAQALSLGMQDPNANQVVNIPMPNSDKLVTVVSYDEMYGVSDEAYDRAIENLQGYYLQHAGEDN